MVRCVRARKRADGFGIGGGPAIALAIAVAGCGGGAAPAPPGAARVVLVVGFGAFEGIDDNPAAAVARALDGRELVSPSGRPVRIVGQEMPVSYARGVASVVDAARQTGADFVIGVGVDERRDGVFVEGVARGGASVFADVDGVVREARVGLVPSTVHPGRLAEALDAGLSVNAGDYVCNAWLWDAPLALAPVPVGFVHLPRSGIDPDRLAKAVARMSDDPRGVSPG